MFFDTVPPFKGKYESFINGSSPYDYFLKLFPAALLVLIVEMSNLYAVQNNKENFKLTVGELYIFLGINIMMTYIKYPSIRMYWSNILGLRIDLIVDSMTGNRFEEIRRFLHFCDNNDLEKNSRGFAKISPVLTALHSAFHDACSNEEFQSIDEMIIPFKGRSHLKQYVKNKPKKWGFKVWVRAGVSGYVHCFELYEGAKKSKTNSELGPIGDMVVRLCHGMNDINCKLFFDNYFTSYVLMKHLLELGIHSTGTLRKNRFPSAINDMPSEKEMKKKGRGSSFVVTSGDNISVVRWMDNNFVHVASTFRGVAPVDMARRYDRKTKSIIQIERPAAIQIYNMYMGGVDLMDRMIAHYPHSTKGKRWYLRVFFHFLNVAIVNAWILYKKNVEIITLVEFKAALVSSLIYTGRARMAPKKRGRPSEIVSVEKKSRRKVPNEVRFDGVNHYPKKTDEKNAQRCSDGTCSRRTRYMCEKCQRFLCPECFRSFHSE